MSTRMMVHRAEPNLAEQTAPHRDFLVSGYEISHLALRNRRLIVASTLLVMIIVGVALFLVPNHYVSTATILPSSDGGSMNELRSLAGLAGLMPKDNNPSALFPTVLTSRMMYDALLAKTFSFEHNGQSMTMSLSDYFGQSNPDRLRSAVSGITAVSADKKSGVISMSIETRYPGLSQAVLVAYLAELEDYNLNKRQSQAKENALYLEKQMTDRTATLVAAEDSLDNFQRRNRDWINSSDPEVAKIIARLQREVEVNNQAYLFLRQQYEIAQLEAQKDVPIVRVLDRPSLPTIKSRPHRLSMIAAAGLVTAVFTLLVIFLINRLRRREDSDPGYIALREEISVAFPRANRLVSRLGRSVRPLEPTV